LSYLDPVPAFKFNKFSIIEGGIPFLSLDGDSESKKKKKRNGTAHGALLQEPIKKV